ncbi:MAG TPA: MFS transporter [Verrucomicrobiae bacterium]|nr:MFS transporter [Verrucomicrobiae bacterium]
MQEAEAPEPISSTDHYAVFRLRDFRLYLAGRLVAVLGQQMLTVAVGWELYERTRSPLALGIVGLAEMIAMVCCTLPSGHLADNFNRKRIILAALLVSSCASLGLALISWWRAPVPWVYACLFTAAAAQTFLWPANAAFLVSLVPRELFPRAVTWNSGAFQLSSVAGPALGGALIALLKNYSSHPAAFIYALNFLAAMTYFFCMKSVRAHHVVTNPEPMSLKSFAAGFRFIFAQRLILGMITLDMFAVFLGGATALLPVFAKDILNAGASGLGLLQAALPVGSVTCALFLAHRPPLQKAGRALLWCVTVFGLATVAFGILNGPALGRWLGISPPAPVWFWLSFAMLFICGAVDNVSVVVRHTSVQLLTPDEKRGRVSAVNSLFIGTSNQLGGFESGFTAFLFGEAMNHSNATGAIVSVVTGGIGTILVVIAVAWIWPEIRKYGKLA